MTCTSRRGRSRGRQSSRAIRAVLGPVEQTADALSVTGSLELTTSLAIASASYDALKVETYDTGTNSWNDVPRGELTIGIDADPNLLVVFRTAGWKKNTRYRIRVTTGLKDDFGRNLQLPDDVAIELQIPLDVTDVAPIYIRSFKLGYDTAKAASNELGGAFTGGLSLGFTGAVADPFSGLLYLRNRWYDPASGSWLSQDPLGDRDSPNLYGFVGVRPHEKTDPLGLLTWRERAGVVLGKIWQGVQNVASALPERIIESQTESYIEDQALNQFGPQARDRMMVGNLQKNVKRAEREVVHSIPGVNSAGHLKRVVAAVAAGDEAAAVYAVGDLTVSAMGDAAVVRGLMESGGAPEGVPASRRAPPVNDYDVAGWQSYYAENPGYARSVGAAGARGGRGPVDKGKAGVVDTIADETLSGNTVAGTEVTIDTAGGRVRLDVVARTPSGQLRLIDSKKGPRAGLTPNQRTGYPALGVTGGIPRGKKAQAAGLTPGEPLDPNDVIIRKSD